MARIHHKKPMKTPFKKKKKKKKPMKTHQLGSFPQSNYLEKSQKKKLCIAYGIANPFAFLCFFFSKKNTFSSLGSLILHIWKTYISLPFLNLRARLCTRVSMEVELLFFAPYNVILFGVACTSLEIPKFQGYFPLKSGSMSPTNPFRICFQGSGNRGFHFPDITQTSPKCQTL